jgi:hypothetical protein
LLLHPSPSVTVGEAREQASGVLGVPLDAVDLKDATGRRLHKNDATFEQYGAQLPIEVSEARGLRGGMPPKQSAFGLYLCSIVNRTHLCVVSVWSAGKDEKKEGGDGGKGAGAMPLCSC